MKNKYYSYFIVKIGILSLPATTIVFFFQKSVHIFDKKRTVFFEKDVPFLFKSYNYDTGMHMYAYLCT